MSATPTQQTDQSLAGGAATIIDLSAIDIDSVHASRERMLELIPHRHEMALLDHIVWASDDFTQGVGSLSVKGDEFWVRGHFPDKPMLPGVLMVEAGAQLACYLYNLRAGHMQVAAFLRIEDAVFRRSVGVNERMLVLCKEIKHSPRRFISQVQGVVDDQVCFEAKIAGMRINTDA